MLIDDYLHLWSSRGFDWNNRATCVHFAGGWVKAIEGRDPLSSVPDFRGRFAAGRIISLHGSFEAAVTEALGRAPLESPRLAQVGDIVLLPGQSFGTLGICNGRRAAVLTEGHGVDFLDMEQAEAAWRVAP